MMNFTGDFGGFIWALLMIIFMALPSILAFWVFFTLTGWFKDRDITPEYNFLGDLKVRLAKGKITFEDYLSLKARLP